MRVANHLIEDQRIVTRHHDIALGRFCIVQFTQYHCVQLLSWVTLCNSNHLPQNVRCGWVIGCHIDGLRNWAGALIKFNIAHAQEYARLGAAPMCTTIATPLQRLDPWTRLYKYIWRLDGANPTKTSGRWTDISVQCWRITITVLVAIIQKWSYSLPFAAFLA